MAGFRNLLVHDYMRLDSERVRRVLDEAPEIFNEFVAALRDWMASNAGSH